MSKSIILTILSLILACACAKQLPQPDNKDTLPSMVKSIIVLPVRAATETDADSTSPQAIKQMQNGLESLAQIINGYFADNQKIHLMSNEEVSSFSTSYSANQSDQALAIGKALKAEAVMFWDLTRYNERTGSDYAAKEPASVAFTYRLVHTESGQTLCAGSFDETQQSATENLLSWRRFANRGFKWVTAADLAREGVTEKLPDCPYLKPAEP